MNKEWQWLVQYVGVIVLAIVLAAALGSMDLFEHTTLGRKLSAASIVQFLGYGAALAVFWLLGQRVAATLRSLGGKWTSLQDIVLPLVTLIVVASAHNVILLVLRRAMSSSQRNLYNWLFIAGIIAAAAWLIVALFRQSTSLTEAVTATARSTIKKSACPGCGAEYKESAKFCSNCGQSLDP